MSRRESHGQEDDRPQGFRHLSVDVKLANDRSSRPNTRPGDCLDGRLNARNVRVNWFISPFAATSYDVDGTDPAFRVDINGDSEEHATVQFTLRAAWLRVGKFPAYWETIGALTVSWAEVTLCG
ncbi:hypothetical protein AB0H88_14110 [Nonomuraea sp. NPDC050680]|uniref:hypothetical protein n=1 Tax=Nonomuraea sp. NPDC050680 TaxID=3154630 RepID=UPI0033E0C2C3